MHTPWKIQINAERKLFNVMSIQSGDDTVATIHGNDEVSAKRARLIAAAPDLLAELRTGIELEAGDLVGVEFKKARNAWLQSARAAIDKATKP